MNDGSTVTGTAIAKKMLTEFWGDYQPHSIREFKNFLQQNNVVSVNIHHISSALYYAHQQGELERVSRGIYQAGKNFNGTADAHMEKTCGVKFVLQQTMQILSLPINIMGLSLKERDLIPRMQILYEECESMLEELESSEDEISE